MTYPFPPDVQQLVREQMALGSFSSEDELLRAALHALEEQRQAVVYYDPETLVGTGRGLDEMKAGLGRPFEEFDAKFRAN